jgi:hypothetical protein
VCHGVLHVSHFTKFTLCLTLFTYFLAHSLHSLFSLTLLTHSLRSLSSFTHFLAHSRSLSSLSCRSQVHVPDVLCGRTHCRFIPGPLQAPRRPAVGCCRRAKRRVHAQVCRRCNSEVVSHVCYFCLFVCYGCMLRFVMSPNFRIVLLVQVANFCDAHTPSQIVSPFFYCVCVRVCVCVCVRAHGLSILSLWKFPLVKIPA